MRRTGRRLGVAVAAVSVATLVVGGGLQMHPRTAAAASARPFTGSFTQDGTYPWSGTPSVSAFDASMTFNWLPDAAGSAWTGHSVLRAHVTMKPDGTGTFQAYELFIGTGGGRQGEAVFFDEGTITNFVDYQGTARCLGGTEGLSTVQCFGTYVGRVNVGGHWTGGTYEIR